MMNPQPMKRIMNTTTRLQVTFEPASELNSWAQRIEPPDAATANGARASARFIARNLFSRPRLFAASHALNHIAPVVLLGGRITNSHRL
jgi:hypothetical protein